MVGNLTKIQIYRSPVPSSKPLPYKCQNSEFGGGGEEIAERYEDSLV